MIIMMIVAFLLGLILCMLFGVPYIDFLKKHLFGQYIKDVAPKAHAAKAGTPTTGGVFIVGAIILSSIITLMLAQKLNNAADIILLTFFFYTLAGFQDDFLKIKGKDNDGGLSAKGKLLRQIGIALLPAIFVTIMHSTNVQIGYNYIDLSWFYPILAVFLITGFSNAFNLTDGLDGLATSVGIPIFIASAIIADLLASHEAAIISAATAGALCGFLKYNKPKAKVFMGDTGSLALGGLIGTLAIVGKYEFMLLLFGGMLIIETMSVILQVIIFKTTGKRIFKMAPLHHHYELEGWSEKKIVAFFALLSTLFSIFAVYYFWIF